MASITKTQIRPEPRVTLEKSVSKHRRFLLPISLLLGLLADIVSFHALLGAGIPWTSAQVFSLSASAMIVLPGWIMLAKGGMPGWRWSTGIGTYLALQLLSLFLRGGVMAALVESAGLAPQVAIILSAAVAAVVIWIGASVGTHPHLNDTGPTGDWRRLSLALIAYGVVLSLAYRFTFELIYEEGYYWNYGQHLDIGYLDHPPMVGWLIWLFTALLGHSEFAVRSGSLLCWVITAYFIYRLTHAFGGATAAFKSLLLVVLLPAFFATGLLMTPDAPLIACWAGGLYFLYLATIEEKGWAWLIFGLFMGVGMLSKYPIALLGLSALVFLIADHRSRVWLRRPEPYLGAVLALALFAPVLAWNAHHQWMSFEFQTTKRLAGSLNFDLHILLLSALVLLTPTGLAAAALVASQSIIQRPAPERVLRGHRLLILTVALPLLVFLFFSLFRQTKLNWTAPLWLGALPCISTYLVLNRFWSSPPQSGFVRRLRAKIAMAWPATLVGVLLLFGALFHFTVLGLPGIGYHPDLLGIHVPIGVGMADLARNVDELEQRFERDTGVKPFTVCVDSNRVASWIAFYRAKRAQPRSAAAVPIIVHDTTGGHPFGDNSRMYRLWHPLANLDQDRPVLLIGVKKSHLMKPEVTTRTIPVTPVKEMVINKNAKRVTSYFYQFARWRTEDDSM